MFGSVTSNVGREAVGFQVGESVSISSLQNSTQYNGLEGTVRSVPNTQGRVAVRFRYNGEWLTKSIAGANLRKVRAAQSPSSSRVSGGSARAERNASEAESFTITYRYPVGICVDQHVPSAHEKVVCMAAALLNGDRNGDLSQALGRMQTLLEAAQQSGDESELNEMYRQGAALIFHQPELAEYLIRSLETSRVIDAVVNRFELTLIGRS